MPSDRRASNRRAFPRWSADFSVRYNDGGNFLDGKPVEIGEGGLSFVGAKPFPLGTNMEVEFRLGDAPDWVRIKGVVRHSDGNTTGIEFLNLRRADRLKLVDFMKPLVGA